MFKLLTAFEFAHGALAHRLLSGRHGNGIGVPVPAVSYLLGSQNYVSGVVPVPSHLVSGVSSRISASVVAHAGRSIGKEPETRLEVRPRKYESAGLAWPTRSDVALCSGLCRDSSDTFVAEGETDYFVIDPDAIAAVFSTVSDFARTKIQAAFEASAAKHEATEGAAECNRGFSPYRPDKRVELDKELSEPRLRNQHFALAALLDGLETGRFKVTEQRGISKDNGRYNSLTLLPKHGYRLDASDFLLAAGAYVRTYTSSEDRDGCVYWYDHTERYEIIDTETGTDAVDLVVTDTFLVSWIGSKFPEAVAALDTEVAASVPYGEINKVVDASVDSFILEVVQIFVCAFAPTVAATLQQHDNALRMGGQGLMGR